MSFEQIIKTETSVSLDWGQPTSIGSSLEYNRKRQLGLENFAK